ncbi:hypothetical protein [Streptosporangium lutulentum]|uniref:Uncharacterized protein n=1 Tax=Streptosporangium lutulentum TaxID=1461250 RepID=A0ABT9QDB4_9ACTN|nr:hypothetical protein [Streptosporangium lutulentum]MDP9844054.1 hypothetical protein [Streptosporangium lutulentum]
MLASASLTAFSVPRISSIAYELSSSAKIRSIMPAGPSALAVRRM